MKQTATKPTGGVPGLPVQAPYVVERRTTHQAGILVGTEYEWEKVAGPFDTFEPAAREAARLRADAWTNRGYGQFFVRGICHGLESPLNERGEVDWSLVSACLPPDYAELHGGATVADLVAEARYAAAWKRQASDTLKKMVILKGIPEDVAHLIFEAGRISGEATVLREQLASSEATP